MHLKELGVGNKPNIAEERGSTYWEWVNVDGLRWRISNISMVFEYIKF
jgi:hypothetical protein